MRDETIDDDWYFENVTYFSDPDGRHVEPGPSARWQAWWQLTAERLGDVAQGDPIGALAAGQGFVLPVAQVNSFGVTRARRRTLVANGAWQAPRPGVIAPLAVEDADPWLTERRRHALVISAAAFCNPGHAVSGRSAAVLHGLPTFVATADPVLTADARTTLGNRGAVHARGASLAGNDVETWFGVPVTTVARTLVDLGRHDRRDALIAADAALHESITTRAAIDAALDAAQGWPGIRQARDVLALACPLAESPLESLVRLALHDDGFPPPEPQVEIVLPGRRRSCRVDFLWPVQRLIVEADGLRKYAGEPRRHENPLQREKKREIALRRLGYRVERVIWTDVVDDWPATSALLRDALAA